MKKVWKYKRCEAKKAVKNGTLLDEAKAIINADRQRDEALDVACTAMRFVGREHE